MPSSESRQSETQVQAMPAINFRIVNSELNSGGGSMFSNNVIQMPAPPKPIEPSKAKRCPNPSQTFTGRDDALKKIEECFFADDGQQHIFVLHGLGGAGKTQIAYKFISEYCYNSTTNGNSRHIPLAFHLDASSAETLKASFNEIATSTGLGTTKDDVITWLGLHVGADENWVLFFDNADDTELDLKPYFPSGSHGNILITTRNADAPGEYTGAVEGSSYCVTDLKLDEARTLLRKVISISTISNSDLDDLAESLGYLALALVQAGSAIRNWKITVPQYLEEFRKRRSEIFRDDGTRRQKLDSYRLTVYTTWIISYNKLSPVAKEFLDICSFIHNKGIFEEFFQMATQEIPGFIYLGLSDDEQAGLEGLRGFLGNFMKDGAWDTLYFREAIAELKSFSLLQDDDGSYSIHLLVHQWARSLAADEKTNHHCALFLFALQQKWKGVVQALKLVPHLQELLKGVDVGLLSTYVVESFGIAYLEAAWARQAQQLLGHVLEVKRRDIGQSHRSTLETTGTLASANQLLGNLKEAEEMQRKVMEQRKDILGEDHPDTIIIMTNLAETLVSLGKMKEAEEMLRKVLEQRKAIQGENHSDTLTVMNNLAGTLQHLGKLKEAEEMQRHVLEQRKTILGENHPDTITSMNNLAWTLLSLGQLKKAEEMQRKVLEQNRAMLGENHPTTITGMSNLAAAIYSLGNPKEAEEIQRKVLEQRKTILGENHPNTITSTSDLAWTLRSLGRLKEAEEMQRGVMEQRRVILGDDHPDTITSMNNLALTLQSLWKLKEAKEMQRRVMEQRKVILGEDHPDTITSMNNLAETLQHLGELEEAEEMQRKVLEQNRAMLGENHPASITSMNNLAATIYSLGKPKEAEEMQRKVLEQRKTILGENHPDTIASVNNLAMTLRSLGKLKEAEEMQRKALEQSVAVLGENHPATITIMSNFAVTLQYFGKLKEAERMQRKVLEQRKDILGGTHPGTVAAQHLYDTIKEQHEHVQGQCCLVM